MNKRLYRLEIKNKTSIKQKVLAFLVGGVLSAGLIYYFIVSIDSESLWLPILIFIVGLLLIFYVVARLLADKKPLPEEIHLTEEGVVSRVYGTIDFKTIHYTVEDAVAGEIHFLRIFLKNGKKYTWERSNANQAAEDSDGRLSEFCTAFIEAFQNYKAHTTPDFPRDHKFIFYKESGYFYALFCFVFVPVLLTVEDINAVGWWVLPVIFIPLIGGIVLVFKKVVQKEDITLYKNRLISKKYGQVNFQDITEIISSEDERRPALTLKLKNGKTLSWKTPVFGPNQSEKEMKLMYAEIRHFIADFCELTDQYSGATNLSTEHNSSKSISETTSFQRHSSKEHKKTAPQFSTTSSNFSREKDSNQERRSIPHTRKKKNIYIGVPAGIAVSLLILSRNCAGEYQKKKSPFYQLDQKTENVQQQALSLLNDFTQKNGPYYVYSNQDSVEIFYYPTKKVVQEKNPAEMLLERAKAEHTPEALQQSNRTMDFYHEMQYAKQYPDSVNWQMLLRNPKTAFSLQKSIFNQSDSTNTYLYLTYFIPDAPIERIPAMQAYAKRKGLPETEDRTGAFAIPVYKDSSVEEYLESENFPLQRFLYLGEHFEDKMQIYIVAQKQNGISETEFKKLSAEILKLLETEKMRVEGFKHKVLP